MNTFCVGDLKTPCPINDIKVSSTNTLDATFTESRPFANGSFLLISRNRKKMPIVRVQAHENNVCEDASVTSVSKDRQYVLLSAPTRICSGDDINELYTEIVTNTHKPKNISFIQSTLPYPLLCVTLNP
jgi:hypothetical protein